MDEQFKLFRGVRSYHLIHDKLGTRIRGMYGTIWDESRLTASCRNSQDLCRKHLRNKSSVCRCGIYALYNEEIAQQYPSIIYGDVVGWGAIVHAEKGWRAEHVRIDRLWIDISCIDCTGNITKSDWFINTHQSFLCKDHLTQNIIAESKLRNYVSGTRTQEILDELSQRYTETEITLGSPFVKNLVYDYRQR